MIATSNKPMYEPHGLFIGYFDDSQTLRTPSTRDSFKADGVRERFSQSCQSLAEDMGFKNSNNIYSSSERKTNRLPLYSPVFAAAFGHHDEIGFILVDNLAESANLTSQSPELEYYTLALCPTLPYTSNHLNSPLFVPAAELLCKTNRESNRLVSLTHLRITGHILLRHGLNAVSEVAGAIVRKVAQLQEQIESEPAKVLAATASDYACLKCSIVEPLSQDDLILILTGNNYSAIATAIAAIRTMTSYDVLFPNHAQTNAAESKSPLPPHRDAVAFRDNLISRSAPEITDIDNELKQIRPLFVSTYTTLGAFSSVNDLKDCAQYVTGHLSVYGVADVAPGYDYRILEHLTHYNDSQSIVSEEGLSWQFFHPGHHDIVVSLENGRLRPKESIVRTSDAFVILGEIYAQQAGPLPTNSASGAVNRGTANVLKELRGAMAKGVLDLSTHLAVPIYSLPLGGATSEYVPRFLRYNLSAMQYAVTHESLSLCDSIRTLLRMTDVTDFKRLLHSSLRLPPSARAAAHLAFNDFISAIANPLSYDDVLDMVDAFSVFRNYIHDMAAAYEQGAYYIVSDPRYGKHQDFSIRFIADVSAALHTRISWSGSHSTGRFYGGMPGNSICDLFFSAEALLKCSTAAIRYQLFPDAPHGTEARSCVGAVLAPQLNQRPAARIGTSPDGKRILLNISVDQSHLLNPCSLVEIIHEVGHFAFNTSICTSPHHLAERIAVHDTTRRNSEWDRADRELQHWDMRAELLEKSLSAAMHGGYTMQELYEHTSELAADAMVRSFVFGPNDDCMYARYMTDSFADLSSEISRDVDDAAGSALLAWASMTRRIYLVCMWDQSWRGNKPLAWPTYEKCIEFCLGSTRQMSHMKVDDILECDAFLYNAYGTDDTVLRQIVWEPFTQLNNRMFGVPSWQDHCLDAITESHRAGTPFPTYAEGLRNWDESQVAFTSLRAYIRWSQQTLLSAGSAVSAKDRESHFAWVACTHRTLWHIAARQRCRRLIELTVKS